MERFVDGRRRRDRFRGGERSSSEAGLGEGTARITARGDTLRFRQRFSEIHRLRQTVKPRFSLRFVVSVKRVFCLSNLNGCLKKK